MEGHEEDDNYAENYFEYTFPNEMSYYQLKVHGEADIPSRIHYGITDKEDKNYIIATKNPPYLELTIHAGTYDEKTYYSDCFSDSVIGKFIEHIQQGMRVRGTANTAVEFKNPPGPLPPAPPGPLPPAPPALPPAPGIGHSAPAAGGKRAKRTGRKRKHTSSKHTSSKHTRTSKKRSQKRATKKQSRRVK